MIAADCRALGIEPAVEDAGSQLVDAHGYQQRKDRPQRARERTEPTPPVNQCRYKNHDHGAVDAALAGMKHGHQYLVRIAPTKATNTNLDT
jgi:hypothetical protein